MDSDAGGEDDDFGDEVRSDDEEEVGNDDANEGGGTLHQVCGRSDSEFYKVCVIQPIGKYLQLQEYYIVPRSSCKLPFCVFLRQL